MLEELCDTQLEAVNWGLMEVRFFRRAEGAEADGEAGEFLFEGVVELAGDALAFFERG